MLVKCLSFSPNQPKKNGLFFLVFGEELTMISQSFISIAPQVPRKSLPEAALASQKFSLDPKSKRYRHSFLQQTRVFLKGRNPVRQWGSENFDASYFCSKSKKNNGRDV